MSKTARIMKDSGIEWIGEIPVGWETNRLKYIVSYNDETLNDNTDENFEFDYIDIGSVEYGKGVTELQHMFFKDAPSRARRIVRKDDIILSTVRTYLKAVATIGKFLTPQIVSTGFIVLRARRRKILPNFLRYAILSNAFISLIEANSVGISYPAINSSDVVILKIPLPPIPEQTRIAAYLDEKCGKIDAVIAGEEAIIEKLKGYKQSLITETVTKGLNPNAPVKDSGIEWIGEIPKGWGCTRVKNLLQSKRGSLKVGPFGSQIKGSDFKDFGVPVYNQRVVLDNNFSDFNSFISEEKFQELIAFAIEPLDILITTRGTIGKIAIVPRSFTPGIIHPCIIKFSIDRSIVSDQFLKYVFNETSITLEQLILKSNATTIAVIYSDSLCNVWIPLPPLSEQKQIAAYLDKKCAAIDSNIASRQSLIEKLTAYKKSLIYEVVTGKKEV